MKGDERVHAIDAKTNCQEQLVHGRHLFAQECPKGLSHRCQKHIKPEVELHAIDEVRICHVMLHNPVPARREAAETRNHVVP